MLLHTPSLLVAFALILVLASAASVSVGLKQQSRRGARWWVVANAIFAAAPALLLEADRHGGGAREHEGERERDEQGRGMQEHAQILGSGPPGHGALWRAVSVVVGESVTNWQGPIGVRATRAARSSCNNAPYTARR